VRTSPLTRSALITGATGQDGFYLAEHLLGRGYEVWAMVRGQANPRVAALRRLLPDLQVVHGDLLDPASLIAALAQARPDEVYNLAAVSYVPLSWQQPELTTGVTGTGVLRVLEAIRTVGALSPSRSAQGQMRFYQASSSEMFGNAQQVPQNEDTPFHPRSPYGVAKAYGHFITQNYRESYGMHAVSGILFNHESPRRGAEFVTRKVSLGVARIKLGQADKLRLGNLAARRDWGFARDYVEAMRLMLDHEVPDTYVIGTGRTHSVGDLVELAFRLVGLDWHDHVVVDPALSRRAEVDVLCADAGKARERLGWQPRVSFEELVALMVEADLALLSGPPSRDDVPVSSQHW
jgi:GDPmannose 4,6-dehydratase